MNFELAYPIPVDSLQEMLGEGQTVYAMDAVNPTVLWTLTGPRGPLTFAADLAADGRVMRVSLSGGQ